MTSLNGPAAATRAEGTALNRPGFCLQAVYGYFANPPTTGPGSGHYDEAIDVWNYSTDRHPGDRNPPRGAVVLWGPAPGPRWPGDTAYRAGDICMGLGGGNVRVTDYPTAGRIGTCSIDQRTAQVQRPYLGWCGDFVGYPIAYLGREAIITNPANDPEEDDDMATMKGAAYKRAKDGATVYLLFNDGSGFYSEHTVGNSGAYNNPIAQDWGTGSWPTITESHATTMKTNLDKVRTGK